MWAQAERAEELGFGWASAAGPTDWAGLERVTEHAGGSGAPKGCWAAWTQVAGLRATIGGLGLGQEMGFKIFKNANFLNCFISFVAFFSILFPSYKISTFLQNKLN